MWQTCTLRTASTLQCTLYISLDMEFTISYSTNQEKLEHSSGLPTFISLEIQSKFGIR